MYFWSVCDALCCLKHGVLAVTYCWRLKPKSSFLLKWLLSGAKAPALNSQCPTGADSCDRDRFWKTLIILALVFYQLCALQCGLVADSYWATFKAAKVP